MTKDLGMNIHHLLKIDSFLLELPVMFDEWLDQYELRSRVLHRGKWKRCKDYLVECAYSSSGLEDKLVMMLDDAWHCLSPFMLYVRKMYVWLTVWKCARKMLFEIVCKDNHWQTLTHQLTNSKLCLLPTAETYLLKFLSCIISWLLTLGKWIAKPPLLKHAFNKDQGLKFGHMFDAILSKRGY